MTKSGERLRLFVAVSVPIEVLRALDRAIEPHRAGLPGARWTPVANQHLTLKFLGSLAAERLPALTEACGGVATGVATGSAAVSGLGAFPNERRARVLWAGIDDPDGVFVRLAGGLDARFAALGFEPEKRSFTPHLTLARLKTPASVRALVEEVAFRPEPFEVASFHLFRSHLSPKGARYEILDTFPLAGAGRHQMS